MDALTGLHQECCAVFDELRRDHAFLGLVMPPDAFRWIEVERFLLANEGEAYLAKASADFAVATRVTPVGPARLHTLSPVHEDLDDSLGFLGSEVLPQKRE